MTTETTVPEYPRNPQGYLIVPADEYVSIRNELVPACKAALNDPKFSIVSLYHYIGVLNYSMHLVRVEEPGTGQSERAFWPHIGDQFVQELMEHMGARQRKRDEHMASLRAASTERRAEMQREREAQQERRRAYRQARGQLRHQRDLAIRGIRSERDNAHARVDRTAELDINNVYEQSENSMEELERRYEHDEDLNVEELYPKDTAQT